MVVRPDWGDTACRWGAEQLARKTIAYAAQSGWSVRDLYGDDATKAKIIAELPSKTFASVLGHGNETTYTAQRQEVVLVKGDPDTDALCAKGGNLVMNFLTCLVGEDLLPYMIEKGLKAAKGYSEEFVFVTDPANFPDSVAEPFFRAHCEFDRVYLQTEDEDTAWDAEMAAWQEEYNKAPVTYRRYIAQDMDSSWLHKAGHEPPPEPQPSCPTSQWVVRNMGWKWLSRLRKIRKALFGIEPGYP